MVGINMATPFRERPEFVMGRAGEHTVLKLVQAAGWLVVPSFDYVGEGEERSPRMMGATGFYKLPDFDMSKKGRRAWLEIKTKTEPTFTYCTGRREHGFAYRLYVQYRAVEDESGCPAYIAFHEKTGGRTLFGQLAKLDAIKRVHHGNEMDVGGTVFFPRDALSESLCVLDGLPGEPPEPWPEQRADEGNDRQGTRQTGFVFAPDGKGHLIFRRKG